MGAAIVAGVDASPILQPAEHVLDAVALAIDGSIVRDRHFSIGLRRDARIDTAGRQSVAEPVGVVSPISNHRFDFGQRIEHECRALVVGCLPLAEQHDQRSALAIADGVELGVQAAFGASDTSGNSPFLRGLAAVRCALSSIATASRASDGLTPASFSLSSSDRA